MCILKQVKETEGRLEVENRALLDALIRSQQGGNALGLTVDEAQLTLRQVPHALPDDYGEADILPALRDLHFTQNNLDLERDTADLRGLMHEALAQSSDVKTLRVLQVRCPVSSFHSASG